MNDGIVHLPASHLFLNNRTFLCAFPQQTPNTALSGCVLMCVTPDEGDIYKRQTFRGDAGLNVKTLREWWQSVPIEAAGIGSGDGDW